MAASELKTLGRYNIERVLGKGAMGVVYEGLDPRLGRRVAIKTILKSHLDDDTAKDFAMRFVREAQAVARLNHPHIVQVYDFGEEGDIAYLVMEFIRGKELKNFFDANERFDIKEAVRIMCELCEALDFAHHAGIVHRDIKPANVMLDHQARTKLTDFGVARVQDTDKTSVERTQAGTMVGTPAYMSPEQITGGTIDRRTDVFSAGIILYQFLTGEKPFTGSGAWTIAKKIIQEEPPVPSSLNNAVTPLFDAVVNKALAKDPDQRYQSAKDFAIALKRALEGKSEEDDADKTIVGAMPASAPARPAPRPAEPRTETTRGGATSTQAGSSQEVELEFWRSIKDGNDPDDFELYVQQFPTGIYAALAKRKIQKLRGVAPEETSAKIKEQERREAEEAAKREAAALAKLNEEKAKLEAEYQKREAEAKARAEAAEKARLEAIEKAKQEAAAELAKREAEYKRREAEAEAKRQAEEAKRQADAKARAEAEAKARAEAEAKAKREAEARAKVEAEARAKREAEEKARREAEAKARAEAEARAKREAEEKAKRDAEIAKREAELKRLEAEAQAVLSGDETVIARKTRASRVTAVVAGLVVAVIAGGAWYWTKPDASQEAKKVAELQQQLQEAKRQEAEFQKAKQREGELLKQVELAKQREEEARKSGDIAKQRELAEQTRQREAEAKKQTELTKQREVDAKKQADVAKQREADVAKQRDAEARKQADAAARQQRDAEAKKQADAARVAAEKAAAEKLAAERAKFEREAAERIAAAERAAKVAQEKAAAAEKAAAEAAEKAKRTQVARAPSNVEALLQQAAAKESEGNNKEAVKLYVRAARAGSGKAAKRLGDIYTKGVDGVPRDYAESLKWYNAARVLGEEVDLQKSR